MHSRRLRACFGIASLIFMFGLATVHDKDGKVIKDLARRLCAARRRCLAKDYKQQGVPVLSTRLNDPLGPGKNVRGKSRLGTELPRRNRVLCQSSPNDY